MISANELRIGNFIDLSEKQTIFKIIGINVGSDMNEVVWCENSDQINNFYLYDFSGIPLTEEILLNAGFEQSGMYWLKNQVYIYLSVLPNADFEYQYNYTQIGIESVHQLQNLYFALTGEELVIDL